MFEPCFNHPMSQLQGVRSTSWWIALTPESCEVFSQFIDDDHTPAVGYQLLSNQTTNTSTLAEKITRFVTSKMWWKRLLLWKMRRTTSYCKHKRGYRTCLQVLWKCGRCLGCGFHWVMGVTGNRGSALVNKSWFRSIKSCLCGFTLHLSEALESEE